MVVPAFVCAMSEQDVGSYSVVTEILEVICADLGEQPNAAAFLAEVDDDASTGDDVRSRCG